ncbi:MAG TPA: DUF1707 and DUF4190 domain-containing protein [Trebonia sp.]
MTGDQGYGPRSGGPYETPRYGVPGFGPPGMLASAADRDQMIDLLKNAFGEGRLTKDEFDERCTRVMDARTYGDLAPIVADLPGGVGLAAPAVPYQQYDPVMERTSGLAAGALVCGILELFTAGITCIPAVILGHMARSEIRRTGKRGDGMAITGLVLGYLAIAGWVIAIAAAAAITARGGGG